MVKGVTRIFHSADVHGNEAVWKKYLRTAEHYKANVIMLCGDLTGKAIVPIVRRGPNDWYCAPYGKVEEFHSMEEVEKKKQEVRNGGFYAVELTQGEVEELQVDEKKMDAFFARVMAETVDRWLSTVEERVSEHTMVIVNPGNDDHFGVDDVIKKHERVIYPLKRVIDIDEKHQLISCDWVNPTPWDTPRECSERDLMKKLEKEFGRVNRYENLICNFHAPPYNTPLDEAPKLDKDLKPVVSFGTPIMEHVGSKAVKEAILKYQPLLALHGHIHESSAHCYLGRTLCVNPGSEYRKGVLKGYVIDLPPTEGARIDCWRVEG